MDTEARVRLAMRPPTEEVVTEAELRGLFETNDSPRHYIGLEISGFLHMGSLFSTGLKINDLSRAGAQCTIFLADWHTVINDKLGGDWGMIDTVSTYYKKAFGVVCPNARILMGSELYNETPDYWADLVRFAKRMSLSRTRRALTIMGRRDTDDIDLAKLLYPPMQAADIHAMDLDIVHAGTDQRKIHMLVREVFPKMGWKVPVAIHHRLLPSLSPPVDKAAGKMSKSDPDSGILVHDTDDTIRHKISRAWCLPSAIQGNPILSMAKDIIFRDRYTMEIERPAKYGGNITYHDYTELESDYASGHLHPADLKRGMAEAVVGIISPVRDAVHMDNATMQAITSV